MYSTHAKPCFEIHIHNFYEQVGRMIIPFSKLRCKNVRVPSRVQDTMCTNNYTEPVYWFILNPG